MIKWKEKSFHMPFCEREVSVGYKIHHSSTPPCPSLFHSFWKHWPMFRNKMNGKTLWRCKWVDKALERCWNWSTHSLIRWTILFGLNEKKNNNIWTPMKFMIFESVLLRSVEMCVIEIGPETMCFLVDVYLSRLRDKIYCSFGYIYVEFVFRFMLLVGVMSPIPSISCISFVINSNRKH